MTDSFDLTDVPSVAEYKRALLECRPKLVGKKYLDMLQAHYRAADHTLTAGDLADAAGYAHFGAANLQYGNFAKELCRVLDRKPKFAVSILATFNGGTPGDEDVRLTMLPPLVTALELLRWVRSEEQTSP